MRTCACGALLSNSNRGKECSSCTATRVDAEITRDPRMRQAYIARHVVGIFCRPKDFPSSEDYMRALDQKLCELTRAVGNTPPDLKEAW